MGPRPNGVFDDPCDDDTLMKFGKHKGTRLAEVPGGYLLYLADQDGFAEKNPGLMDYIEENRVRLEEDKKREKEEYLRRKRSGETVSFDDL